MLLLLTLQREGEVGGLSAAELKLRDRVWTLPKERAKNGRANEVALSEAALAVINGLPTFDNKRRLLFTTTGEAPVSGYSRAKKNLDREMLAAAQEEATERGLDLSKVEIPHWTFHDLRRTGTTGMQRLGIPPHIADAILNHKSGTISGVAAIYARHSYADEKRSALEAWGRFVTTLVENNPAEDVIAIGREKK
jgi:integrase